MGSSRLTAFAAGAIFALVIGGGSAVAATGGKFILGKSNTADATSTLTNKNGTALSLKSGRGPALKVNNGRKVVNLNADKLDGASLADIGWTGAYDADGELVDVDENGINESIIAIAECPGATEMTGGGSANFTESGVTLLDAPFDQESWAVIVYVGEGSVDVGSDVTASVVCFSPDGSGLAGSYRTASPSDGLMARAERLAREKVGDR